MFQSCGCRICNEGLGEFLNSLVSKKYGLKKIVLALESKGIETNKKTIENHLKVYGLKIQENQSEKTTVLKPVVYDLKSVDFEKYNIEYEKIQSSLSLLQKLHLKLHLNNLEIYLFNQKRLLDGEILDVPDNVVKACFQSYMMLEKCLGLKQFVDINSAATMLENNGYIIVDPSENVEDE